MGNRNTETKRLREPRFSRRALSPSERRLRLRFLKGASILAGLDGRVLAKLATDLTVLELEPGQSVFRKGDPGDSMYIVVRGSVRIHDGKYVFTHIEPPGSFGEYALAQNSTRTASATARDRTTLFKLDRALVQRQFRNNCEFTQSLLQAVLSRMIEKDAMEKQISANRLQIRHQRDQLARQRDDLTKQHRQLIRMQAERNRFFEAIMHDLKNPLMGMNLLERSIALEHRNLTAKSARKYLTMIRDTVACSGRLLENLLDWWRSRSGTMQFVPVSINLRRAVQETLTLQRPCARPKRIALRNDTPPSLVVLADARSLSSILRNLVSNAVKYTPPGGSVTVTARALRTRVEVDVKDTGVGMDPQQMAKVLRGGPGISTSGTAGETGTGLGLKICREFVKQNGGTLRATSEPDKGTTFSLSLRKA